MADAPRRFPAPWRVPAHLPHLPRLRAHHPAFRKARACRGDRTVKVDAAAGVLDDDHLEAEAAGVLGRPAHAEIEGEAGEENAGEAALAQVPGEPGRRRAVVLVEGRIGIDLAAKALAH